MSISRAFISRAAKLAWIPALVFAASVFVAEGAFRVAGTRVAATMEGFYEPFGEGGFRHRPNAASFMNWHSGPFHVYTDSTGCRVAQRVGESNGGADARTADVLVLGDSQAFGQGLEYDRTVIGEFARSAAADGVSVANASVAGHFFKNQIELARWMIEVRGVRPKAVLLCLTPRFLGNPDAYSDAFIHNGSLFGARPGKRELVKKWFSVHSAVYVSVRDAMQRGSKAPGAGNAVFELYAGGPANQQRIAMLEERLAELQVVTRPHGVALVLCYAPLAVENEVEALAVTAKAQGVSSNLPFENTAALSHDLGLPLIDLRPALQQARAANEPVTLDGDPHYGPDVSRRAGGLLWSGVDWLKVVGPGTERH